MAKTRPRLRVLIVDDDPLLRLALRDELSHAGLEVASAPDGAAAVVAAAADSPDVIVIDLAMPVLDGWNAHRLIRRGRATAGIPVILLSAHISQGERQKFIQAGFADVVQKPYEIEDLLARLHRAVDSAVPEQP